MTENTSRLLPILSLILAMLLWASSFVALKLAFRGYHPMQVIFGRMLIASLCFLPFVVITSYSIHYTKLYESKS